MFGFVVADRSALTEEQLLRYRGCYCGLCRKIGHTYGHVQRLALNYDLTFLVLLLSSLYEPAETAGSDRCAVHPLTARSHWQTDVTDYAAAMNMALAYHNCMDDWRDEKKPSSCIQAAIFRKSARQAARSYPRQWQAMETCMEILGDLEAADAQEPDAAANAFGSLMAELLVLKEDHWSPLLREMGHALGRFIYLMDAVLDLPEDIRSGSYNPLRAGVRGQDAKSLYKPILTLLMGDCTEAFERLPLIQDLDILRNILYSGVWTRFYAQKSKEAPHV